MTIISTSNCRKMRGATLVLLLMMLQSCGRNDPKAEAPAETQTGNAPPFESSRVAPPSNMVAPKPSNAIAQMPNAAQVGLDIDGDGKADGARIARVGEHVISDPIAFKNADGTLSTPPVDWQKDAIIVKMASGDERALDFPHVEAIKPVRSGSKEDRLAQDQGCPATKSGQALLATAEEGAMLIREEKDQLVAIPCGS